MSPIPPINKLVVYVTEAGKTPFEDWFNDLDTAAALKEERRLRGSRRAIWVM